MSLDQKVSVHVDDLGDSLGVRESDQADLARHRRAALAQVDRKYRDDHRYHCFRCGTQSLVEVDHEGIRVDVCINDGCGAIHLDPGELDQFVHQDAGLIKRIHGAVMGLFK